MRQELADQMVHMFNHAQRVHLAYQVNPTMAL